jgi:hypothetical protein
MKSIRKQRGFIDAIADFAGSALSSVLGFKGQEAANEQNLASAREANEFNARQAALDRQFQRTEARTAFSRNALSQRRGFAFLERMSNTAVRRQVKDMRKAGINPILAARYGGSSSPGAPMATSPAGSGSRASAVMARVENEFDKGINTGLTARRVRNETKRLEQELSNMEASEKNIKTDTDHKEADIALKKASERESTAREILNRKQAGLVNAQHNTEEFRAIAEQENIKNIVAAREEMRERTIREKHANVGRQVEAEMDKTMLGKVTRALGRIFGSQSGAAAINPGALLRR